MTRGRNTGGPKGLPSPGFTSPRTNIRSSTLPISCLPIFTSTSPRFMPPFSAAPPGRTPASSTPFTEGEPA